MIIKKYRGRWSVLVPVCTSVWICFATDVFAWQQEYIAIGPQSNTSERYTWDSDHQPRYEDILAERINASQSVVGFSTSASKGVSQEGQHTLSVGWRVNSGLLWGVRPWAQLNFTQQDASYPWQTPPGPGRMPGADPNGNWVDVTVGADMSLNPHLAAFASLSQSDNTVNGENYLYLMGVSAKF
ncbi:hypothetical protein [Trabulsiella odontotermitis]|uniref:Autotransporter domain-containing protein n=1 Tax=Trabulsiella odontotermitis TaxID=379893 RepID=A0A0L0GQ23_9ENTR|nr:hypothetical protein [Trabulsiella odontotermitis]KNC91135.1 hypothetical protein GM30_24205 [Trabulsiella odontotermitis]KNC95078.1 hypothetical protein GM31_06435 [Trabulsiella odontotermitis]